MESSGRAQETLKDGYDRLRGPDGPSSGCLPSTTSFPVPTTDSFPGERMLPTWVLRPASKGFGSVATDIKETRGPDHVDGDGSLARGHVPTVDTNPHHAQRLITLFSSKKLKW